VTWPNTGEPNRWWREVDSFIREISSETNLWLRNTRYKYLNLTIDTRNRTFRVYDRDRQETTPDSVMDAVNDARKIYKSKEFITEIAIREDPILIHLPKPARHHDLVHIYFSLTGKTAPSGDAQGFLTNRGRFVDRQEACVIARLADQIKEKTGPEDILFSEDLW
jgi:hypothetical protein